MKLTIEQVLHQQLNDLLACYNDGRFSEAELLAISITQEFPHHQFAWKVLGAILGQTDRKSEAIKAHQTAVAIDPKDAEAHNNLGATLKELGRLDEAEVCCKQAIALKSDYAEAHNNLGNMLKEVGRLDEAEERLTQAIVLRPDLAEAHYNLGNTLQEQGRLDEAEASYLQAIGLNPDYAEAHNNLGNTLQKLTRLSEAEASLRQAIALQPNYALTHSNLAKVLYKLGYKDSALESIENANGIDPEEKEYQLILSVIKARKLREETGVAISETDALTRLGVGPLTLNRLVESELINNLYGINSRELDKTTDARYGNGKCSPDFNLFQDSHSIIQTVSQDLTRIMMDAVKSDIFIYDSFFNILHGGGGSTPHKHISQLDKESAFNLDKQKYSLVYYLTVGDQNCDEPGMLKLYEPSEDILPCEGMITIIPATRMHSAVYGGNTDRVMIGVNFYSL